MKQVSNSADLFAIGAPAGTTYGFVDPNFLGLMVNEFLVTHLLAQQGMVLPTQYFEGEAEAFYLRPISTYIDYWLDNDRKKLVKAGDFLLGYDDLAKNATTYAQMLDMLKSKTAQSAYFDEIQQTLAARSGTDIDLDDTKASYKAVLAILGKKETILAALKQGEALGDLKSWDEFKRDAEILLAKGLNFPFPGRNVGQYANARQKILNVLTFLNSPSNFKATVGEELKGDANVVAQIHQQDVFSAIIAFVHYLRITNDSESYSLALPNRLSSATQIVQMDTQRRAAKELAWYYESLAQLPVLYNLKLVYSLMQNQMEFISSAIDIGDSAWNDVQAQSKFVSSVIDKWLYPWASSLADSQLRYMTEVKDCDVLLPLSFRQGLMIKEPSLPSEVVVGPGSPPLSDKATADTRVPSDAYVSMFNSIKKQVSDMVTVARVIEHGLSNLGADLGTEAAKQSGLSTLEVPTFPQGKPAHTPQYRTISVSDPIPMSIPHQMVLKDKDDKKRKIVFSLADHVFSVIRSLRLFNSMRNKDSAVAKQSVTPVSISDVSLTFPFDVTLPIGGSQGVSYVNMPLPYEYVGHVLPSKVANTIPGISAMLVSSQSMLWKYENYFSVAAAQIASSIEQAEMVEPFAAIGSWYQVEGGRPKDALPSIGGIPINFDSDTEIKKLVNDSLDDGNIPSTSGLVYGAPLELVSNKSLSDSETLVDRTIGVYVPSEDKTMIFILHSHLPELSPCIYKAVQLTNGCFISAPLGIGSIAKSAKSADRRGLFEGLEDGLENDPNDAKWIRITGWSKQFTTLPHILWRPSRLASTLMTSYGDTISNYYQLTLASFGDKGSDPRHMHLRLTIPSQYYLIEPSDFIEDLSNEVKIGKIEVGFPFSQTKDAKAAEEKDDKEVVIQSAEQSISKSATTLGSEDNAEESAKQLGIRGVIDSGSGSGAKGKILNAPDSESGSVATGDIAVGGPLANAKAAADAVIPKTDKAEKKSPESKTSGEFKDLKESDLVDKTKDELEGLLKKLQSDLDNESTQSDGGNQEYMTHLEKLIKHIKSLIEKFPSEEELKERSNKSEGDKTVSE